MWACLPTRTMVRERACSDTSAVASPGVPPFPLCLMTGLLRCVRYRAHRLQLLAVRVSAHRACAACWWAGAGRGGGGAGHLELWASAS